MPVDTALIEAVLVPIAGDNPSGKDLRYDPRYAQVKEARREDLVLPSGGLETERKIADYAVALKIGRQLLEKDTKDLQLAAWVTEALLKREGIGGLATGIKVLHGIVAAFWDTCYPAWDEEDTEARAGPLTWVGSKFDISVKQVAVAPAGTSMLDYEVSRTVPTEGEAESNADKRKARAEAVKDGKPMPEEVDRVIAEATKHFYKPLVADVDAAHAAVTELEKLTDERFGRDAPSFGKLRGALEAMRRLAGSILQQKLIDDPDPIVEEAVEAEAATDGGGALTPEPVSPADAAARVAVAARFLRKLDPTNPGPYLMVRGLRWGELRAAAATGEVNPKLLEAAPTAVRTRLKGLQIDGKWPELLDQCESVMASPQGRGWLDLQRYVLTACKNLGSSYDAVATALRDEIRVLLIAIPELPEMTLMDDSPTANPETQAWLAAERLTSAAHDPSRGESGATGAAASPMAEDVVETALTQDDATSRHGGIGAGPRRRSARDPFAIAKGEMSQGRSKQAIEILLAEIASEQSPRGRFLRQTQLAYLMVEGGLDTVARPMLERLASTIEDRKLEEWEAGPLVAQPLALLVRVMDRSQESASSERKALYLRICRLDALQAIALQSSGG